MWVSQWPLTKEKLNAAHQLVNEQLEAGHLKPSTSPWNTPIFVIKKKSGKWRLLHDLRAVNAVMEPMGPVQLGLPMISALPKDWPSVVIDLKDCFFSIPLHADDTNKFAFTLPAINHASPDARYEWTVLPQGMANSPTLCQLYVGKALQPIRDNFSSTIIYHYMDDILLCAKTDEEVQGVLIALTQELRKWNLTIAPEKVQMSPVKTYLGTKLTDTMVRPLKVTLRVDSLNTLNDFQKLLGDINWIRPYCRLTNAEMQPLFDLLKGDSDLQSPRKLTPEARLCIQKVEKRLAEVQVDRLDLTKPLTLCVITSDLSPSGVLWQDGPLMWVYLPHSPNKVLPWYPAAVAQVALKGIKMSVTSLGRQPDSIVTPYTPDQIKTFAAVSDDWAILCTATSGSFDNHYPLHPWLQFALKQPLLFPHCTRAQPIAGAMNIFTDGSKGGTGVIYVEGQEPRGYIFPCTSAQAVESSAVLQVFIEFQQVTFNLISDSHYVVQAI